VIHHKEAINMRSAGDRKFQTAFRKVQARTLTNNGSIAIGLDFFSFSFMKDAVKC